MWTCRTEPSLLPWSAGLAATAGCHFSIASKSMSFDQTASGGAAMAICSKAANRVRVDVVMLAFRGVPGKSSGPPDLQGAREVQALGVGHFGLDLAFAARQEMEAEVRVLADREVHVGRQDGLAGVAHVDLPDE